MPDPRELLPLRPGVFQVLLVLAEGERHGWSLVHELQRRDGGDRLLPGNAYRMLTALLREGLISVVEPSKAAKERAAAETGANAERRRYFRLTPLGRDAARAEARRLELLVAESREKRLLGLEPRGKIPHRVGKNTRV